MSDMQTYPVLKHTENGRLTTYWHESALTEAFARIAELEKELESYRRWKRRVIAALPELKNVIEESEANRGS